MSKAPQAVLLSLVLTVTAVVVPATALPAHAPQKQEKQKKPDKQKKEPPDDGSPIGAVLPYKAALKYYKERLKRKSIMKHTEGRMMLAATKDLRGLKVLAGTYGKSSGKAKMAKDQVAYLLVGIILRYFTDETSADGFAAWRAKHKKTRDAWLWFRTLQPAWMLSRQAEVRAIAKGKENIFITSAALEALARLAVGKKAKGKIEEAELAATIGALLDTPPDDKLDRSILFESCASVLLANRANVRNDTWKPICVKLIQALVDEDIHERSKLALSRRFAEVFDVANLGFEPRMWISKLNQGPAPRRSGGATAATFFGVRSLGERICFVIDASDSMVTRITDREKKRLVALTGSRKKKDGKVADSSLPIEKRLPWDKIRTRFDVAREYLKLSLQGLDKSKSFAVVMFGDEAEPLDATKRLVPANKANIRRAIAELNKIRPKKNSRVLRGKTNLHAGMLQAFRMTTAKPIKKEEHVSRKAMASGCDTIYLLSDGTPSWDSYGSLDKRDVEDGVVDPETGKRFTSQQTMGFYWGPYGRQPHKHMMDDFRRMNLFRKVQIHCVGIGEADDSLLDGIARIGLGDAVKVSPPK